MSDTAAVQGVPGVPGVPDSQPAPANDADAASSDAPTVDPPAPVLAGYDPSVPADEPLVGGYDPSVPADEMGGEAVRAGGYDPSVPADEMDAHVPAAYDPSVPADADEAAAGVGEAEEPVAAVTAVTAVSAPAEEHLAPAPVVAEDASVQEALPVQEEYNGVEDAEAEVKVGLPEGLTDESPSVVANAALVRHYRQYPSDSASALSLFNWAIQKTEIVDARAWYEVLAVENPTAAQPMLALINLELALSNFTQVEALFARALGSAGTLMAAPNVNLWKAYLHYIRRQNPSEGPNAEKARAVVTQAYEYALKECGIDRESGELWQEYIHYIAEHKSKNPWDIQQQNDTLRKLYQRAVAIPLNNVEALWKQYDAFESVQNKLTAKKFLADRSPAYMTARTALREMRQLTDVIPHPIIPPKPQYSDNDRRVVAAWRAYIKWEEGNPLNTDDESLVVQRVGYALKKCMAQMRHYPELWHYAAAYHLGGGRTDEGVAFLKAGVAACPKSFLLTFALAEAEEDKKNYAECHKIFLALIQHLDTEVEELSAQIALEVEAAKGPEIPAAPASDIDGEEGDTSRLIREREERGDLVQERRGKDVEGVKTAAGIVWVMYMRFARRAEGLKAARIVFGKARKSPNVTWHIFEASALMEYHSNKDQTVAVRIFEFGLKLFSEDVSFVMSYLNFLLSINDDTNARALFERSALKIPAEKARPLWDAWARFEYMYGDLTAVHKLEARFMEAFPKDTPLKRFASRYSYNGIDEIAIRDLGFGRAQAAPAPAAAPALPPFPPTGPPRAPSPIRNSPQKRALSPPRSPARVDTFKRARAASPPPPRAGFQPPVPGRFAPGGRSPLPPVRPPVPVAPRAAGFAQPTPGGVPQALSWFIGRLPTTRTFDGPIFRADDIIGLFSNIAPGGNAIPTPGAGHVPHAPHAPHAPHVPHAPVARPPMGRPGGFRGRRF